jgi:hypothetical protein
VDINAQRRQSHEYYKEKIAEKLRAAGAIVETEVKLPIRGSNGKWMKADIALILSHFGREICILEIKTGTEEIGANTIEEIKCMKKYANRAYLCLPNAEDLHNLKNTFQSLGIGLIAINPQESGKLEGGLTRLVDSKINSLPHEWEELFLRLDRRGCITP